MPKDEMRAIVIDGFGGPEVLSVRNVSVPEQGPDQILVRVESAGIGVWDVGEREGMLVKRLGIQPKFPWVLGSEGAGKVVAVGEKVTGFRKGDLVYGHVWGTNPKTGFYAEYTALSADQAWPIPSTITAEQAGALLIDGGTALRGLVDTLNVKEGDKLMVFGASGGLGHLAVQLGKRLGARVFAVASGEDGVALARRLGAEAAVDGHGGDIGASAREFALDGFDAALITVQGQAKGAIEAAENALTAVREGGRVAYPWTDSIRPAPRAPSNVHLRGYMLGSMDGALVIKLNKLIEAGAFEVHLGKTFTLDQAVDAYSAVGSHHLGRLALLPARQPIGT
ncbi:MAG: NADP-dependent oxidoreductase [Thaumarchaeota archaeon]|nr:NADP-dependent oxidoreductase [Nitrososphaerota archaeon]